MLASGANSGIFPIFETPSERQVTVVARLFGAYTHNLDQKNRLAIPAKLRSELGDSFVLTLSPCGERCLLAYTFDDWDDVMQDYLSEPSSEDQMLRQRKLYMNTDRMDLDSQGRMTIPARFVELAGFRREVFMLAVGYHVEFWDPEEYQKMLVEKKDRMDSQKGYLKR